MSRIRTILSTTLLSRLAKIYNRNTRKLWRNFKKRLTRLKYLSKRTSAKMGNRQDKKSSTNSIIKKENTKPKLKIFMKKRLKNKNKKVLKKIKSRKMSLLMKVTQKILPSHLVALFNLKEENLKVSVRQATERIRKKIKKIREIEIERKKKRRTKINLKKWKSKRAINAVRVEIERKKTIDD